MQKYKYYTDIEGLTEYRVTETEETRVRKIFTYIPLWLNRFSWLQNIEVIERKRLVQELRFNDGGTYGHEWTLPKEEWVKEMIKDTNKYL